MALLPDDLHAKLAEWTGDLHRARSDAVWAMLLPLLKEHFELVIDLTGTPIALRCKPAEDNARLRAALERIGRHISHEAKRGARCAWCGEPITGDDAHLGICPTGVARAALAGKEDPS